MSAVGPLPTVEVNGEPGIGLSAPGLPAVLGAMLNPEMLPKLDCKGKLLAEGFAT